MIETLCGSIAGFGFALLVYSLYEARNWKVNTHHVRLKNKHLTQPLRILHLSDTHFWRSDKALSKFFKRLAKQSFDLVLISGDIFDSVSGIESAKEALKKFQARLGVYAVLGNHDYYDYRFEDLMKTSVRGRKFPKNGQPVERFEEALLEAGVKLLRNDRVEFHENGQTLALYGLDDAITGHADLEKMMHGYSPQHLNLLLTHTIDVFFYMRRFEVDLSFSGHSHGGQIQIPGFGPLITHTRFGPAYAEGVKEMKGAICSISRGIGTGRFLPLRFLAPPEAVILEVRGKES